MTQLFLCMCLRCVYVYGTAEKHVLDFQKGQYVSRPQESPHHQGCAGYHSRSRSTSGKEVCPLAWLS